MNYDKDYFKDRGSNPQDYQIIEEWIEYFKPKNVFDFGCGTGKHVEVFRREEIECEGGDLHYTDKDEVNGLFKLDLTIPDLKLKRRYDVGICWDVLEHLPEDKIETAVKNVMNNCDRAIFSICFYGDPNLERDKTHITKKRKGWYMDLINRLGYKVSTCPITMMYSHQILIVEAIK